MKKKILIALSIVIALGAIMVATGNLEYEPNEDAFANKRAATNQRIAEIKSNLSDVKSNQTPQARESELEDNAAIYEPKELMGFAAIALAQRQHRQRFASKIANQVQENIGLDDATTEQITSFMTSKLERDQDIANELAFMVGETEGNARLFQMPDDELTESELEKKQELIKRAEAIMARKGESRLHYEKELTGTLSESELHAYGQLEKDKAIAARTEFMEDVVARFNNIPDIENYQKDQINLVFQRYSDTDIGNIQIGSTVNYGDYYLANRDQETLIEYSKFQEEIAAYLTPQQVEEYLKSIQQEREMAESQL